MGAHSTSTSPVPQPRLSRLGVSANIKLVGSKTEGGQRVVATLGCWQCMLLHCTAVDVKASQAASHLGQRHVVCDTAPACVGSASVCIY